MFTLELNIDEVIAELNLPKNTANVIVEACVEEVKDVIYYNWINAAKQALKSSRNDYINNLIVTSPNPYQRIITLKGVLNNMIEKGADPFDMKIGFSRSAKIKFNKKGQWYLTIPFRFGTPNALGENSAFNGGVMPRSVYKAVRAFPKGLPQSKVPSPYDVPKSRASISIPEKKLNFPAYTNKSSIFAGIRQQTSSYGKGTQNTYQSFRRVGENSDPASWIHSGIKAYNLLDKALKTTDIRNITENKIDEILGSLGY